MKRIHQQVIKKFLGHWSICNLWWRTYFWAASVSVPQVSAMSSTSIAVRSLTSPTRTILATSLATFRWLATNKKELEMIFYTTNRCKINNFHSNRQEFIFLWEENHMFPRRPVWDGFHVSVWNELCCDCLIIFPSATEWLLFGKWKTNKITAHSSIIWADNTRIITCCIGPIMCEEVWYNTW